MINTLSLKKRSAQRGFTLPEVVLAALLLGMLGVVFSATYPVAARVQLAAQNRIEAVRLAERQMDGLRSIDFDNLTQLASLKVVSPPVIDSAATGSFPYSFTNAAGTGEKSVAQSLTGGAGTFTVAQAGAEASLRSISVTVTWSEQGVQRSITLQTFVSEVE